MQTNSAYFPEHKRFRVIIDSDAACECDDNYAILHTMMSQKAELRGVIAEQFGAPADKTMMASFREIEKLMTLSTAPVPVYAGETALFSPESDKNRVGNAVSVKEDEAGSDSADWAFSDGVHFLIEEALTESAQPLFVICQGALTNLATALKAEPSIASRLTAVVIGGTNYPVGGVEFNSMNDPAAFNFLMQSALPMWVIPEEAYSTLQVSFFEIREKVLPCGAVGRYLSDSMEEANRRLAGLIKPLPTQSAEEYVLDFPSGESWSLGDSAGIGVLLTSNSGRWRMVQPPIIGEGAGYTIVEGVRQVRWYEAVHVRFILEDFFAKLRFYYGETNAKDCEK